MSQEEYVVLVDEQNKVLGTMPKAVVHGAQTPLLQQRARTKKTWPLVWSNTCCGHPTLEETPVMAARRRLRFELGLEVADLKEVAPYRYCFTRDGIMENEICPIVIGRTDQEPVPNPDEVEAIRWLAWPDFLVDVRNHPQHWSAWCVEEAEIVAKICPP